MLPNNISKLKIYFELDTEALFRHMHLMLQSYGYRDIEIGDVVIEEKPVFSFDKKKDKKKGKKKNKKNNHLVERVELGTPYLYAPGNVPVMMVAHLDTVHRTLPNPVLLDPVHQVFWSLNGLGADDRAGVIGIVELLELGLRPHVLFTNGEESGGWGVEEAMSNLTPPKLNYIIELDRRGAKDAVFYSCNNPNFTKYVESYGFEKASGSFSDISIICPRWGVAGVNLSTGYHDAHTGHECLIYPQLMDTVGKVFAMISGASHVRYEYIEAVTSYRYGKWSWPEWDKGSWADEHDYGRGYQGVTDLNDTPETGLVVDIADIVEEAYLLYGENDYYDDDEDDNEISTYDDAVAVLIDLYIQEGYTVTGLEDYHDPKDVEDVKIPV